MGLRRAELKPLWEIAERAEQAVCDAMRAESSGGYETERGRAIKDLASIHAHIMNIMADLTALECHVVGLREREADLTARLVGGPDA